MTPKTKRAIDSTFFHHGRFLAVQNHVRSLACSSAVPLRRFTRNGGQQDVIFAYIPPPPAKNFAAAQLMDGGGVLEVMHDVYRRLTFPWHRPRPATQAACPWPVFLDSAAAYRSKTSAGLQPSRCNELDARAISAARVLNIKEVKRKDDDTWNGGGEAQNVTDVKTTDRVCEERCIRV